jgi:hypothetical protein
MNRMKLCHPNADSPSCNRSPYEENSKILDIGLSFLACLGFEEFAECLIALLQHTKALLTIDLN